MIYNVFFHPLRHYPGPWLSAATKIPWYRALLTGDLSFYTQRIHEKYGDIVRISPNELSYITAGAWKDVYANRVNHTLLPKDEKFYHPPPGGAHSILTAPHEAHSRIRRLLSHAFSEKALRDQESLIKVYVDLLVQRLHEESNSKSASLDMVSWYNWTTFDIFGDLMFAEPFGCLDSASYHPWVDLLFKSIKAQTLANAAAHLGILPLLRRFPPKRLVETRLKHMSMTTEKVTKRLDLKTDRADFMGFILKHNDDEFAMSLPEIKSTSFGIIIAGSETTATLLSGTTYYLLKNPEKLAKLTKEVREAFHSEDEINLTSVNGLTYMLAVLDEGLRMYPPVPVGLPRRVPESGETIVGNFVPPNVCSNSLQQTGYVFSNRVTSIDRCIGKPLGSLPFTTKLFAARVLHSRKMA